MSADASASYAWLTTLRGDGSPHTTPVWFVLVDDVFWIATATGNVKLKNVVTDPRVSIAIDGSGPAPAVAQGRARIHDLAANFSTVVELLRRKYDGWDPLDSGVDGPRVLLEIPVERWLMSPTPQ